MVKQFTIAVSVNRNLSNAWL